MKDTMQDVNAGDGDEDTIKKDTATLVSFLKKFVEGESDFDEEESNEENSEDESGEGEGEGDDEASGCDWKEVALGGCPDISIYQHSPIKAIRAKCIDCAGGSRNEVKLCNIYDCLLWPFRLGRNPFRSTSTRVMSDEQRQAVAERFSKGRKKKQAAEAQIAEAQAEKFASGE